jgi:hypothetical protein
VPTLAAAAAAASAAEAVAAAAAEATADIAWGAPLCLAERLSLPAQAGTILGARTTSLVLSDDGRCLVTGSEDGKLHLWVRGGRHCALWRHSITVMACPLRTGPAREDDDLAVSALAMRGTLLLSGASDGIVRAWRCGLELDLDGRDHNEEYEGEDKDEDEDDEYLASMGELLPLHPFERGDLFTSRVGSSASANASAAPSDVAIQSLALPPLADVTLAHVGGGGGDGGGGGGGVEWALPPKCECEWALPPKWAVSGGMDGALCVWETQGGECLQREVHRNASAVMAVSTGISRVDGRPLVMSASADGDVILWQASRHMPELAIGVDLRRSFGEGPLEKACLLRARAATPQLYCARLSADGAFAAAGFGDGTLLLWDIDGLRGPDGSLSVNVNGPGGSLSGCAAPCAKRSLAEQGTELLPGVGSLEWRGSPAAVGRARELTVGSVGGVCSRWTVTPTGTGGAATLMLEQELNLGLGEIYAVACATSGEVLAATETGNALQCMRPTAEASP